MLSSLNNFPYNPHSAEDIIVILKGLADTQP